MKAADYTAAERALAAELYHVGTAAAREARLALGANNLGIGYDFDALHAWQIAGWCAVARHVAGTRAILKGGGS